MCRIAGIVSSMPQDRNLQLVGQMLNAMARGGPDDEGLYNNGSVILGHRRLAIIDLSSAGHQPMLHRNGKVTISFNGELYNYLDLRKELEGLGVQFVTATDTEVIVESYIRWGVRAFARFIGMFAFALHDITSNKIILVRDGQGIKPLYYSIRNSELLFASQVKAFSAFDPSWPEDPQWKKLFLSFGFLPHPYTTLKGVKALSRGCYIESDLSNLSVNEVRYTGDSRTKFTGDFIASVRDTTWRALRRHLISDAPLGVFLSGGIDSSLLTLMASKEVGSQLQTVSVNFNDATFDESGYQKMILDQIHNAQHHSFKATDSMLWESIDDIWGAMDQPTIDGVNSYFVSRAAHESGLKAVLSGLGADELFGGYGSVRRMKWISVVRSTGANTLVANVAGRYKDAYKRFEFLNLNGPVGDYLFLRGIHLPSVVAETLGTTTKDVLQTLQEIPAVKPAGLSATEYAAWLEQEFYMTSQLLKDTDCMSMHFGLEVRVPFLDQELWSTVQAIEEHERFNSSQPKYLLTKAFEDILPRDIIFRKKQGFTFPFALWLDRKLKSGDRIKSVWKENSAIEKNFMNGSIHWSKYWSGVVADSFRQGR